MQYQELAFLQMVMNKIEVTTSLVMISRHSSLNDPLGKHSGQADLEGSWSNQKGSGCGGGNVPHFSNGSTPSLFTFKGCTSSVSEPYRI